MPNPITKVIAKVCRLSDAKHPATGAVLTCYLIPLLIQALVASRLVDAGPAWTLFSLGLSLALCGSIPLFLLLREWQLRTDSQLPNTETDPLFQNPGEASIDDSQETIHRLDAELARSEHQLKQLAKDRAEMIKRIEELEADLDRANHESSLEIKQKESLATEHAQTIQEQRGIIERKQAYILKLENKVRDLSYEVKTLLTLGENDGPEHAPISHPVIDIFNDEEEDPPELQQEIAAQLPSSSEKKVQTPYDAALQLQKCLDTATKLTGASHLAGSGSKLLSLSSESYAIDLRRLFDNYRSENTCAIFFFSLDEGKMLFANNQIKTLLGWSPDHFIRSFEQLIDEGWADWKHALAEIKSNAPLSLRFLMKTKSGEDLLVQCHIGLIPSGAFSGNLVGVLYAD